MSFLTRILNTNKQLVDVTADKPLAKTKQIDPKIATLQKITEVATKVFATLTAVLGLAALGFAIAASQGIGFIALGCTALGLAWASAIGSISSVGLMGTSMHANRQLEKIAAQA
jgi:1,4-dihydroxy-2-naphthoate octaprenyltransferase